MLQTAFHFNGPAHLVRQLLCDGQPYPRAAVVRPGVGMLLGKGFENMALEFLPDANA